MNVILNIPNINWRPLIPIAVQYQAKFIEWRNIQTQVNTLMSKDLVFPTLEYQQRLDLAMEASNLNDECNRIIYAITKDIGWYTEENEKWCINFSLEENDPFENSSYKCNDERPIISLDDYHQKYCFIPDGSIGELISLLSNFPPSWTISKSINIDVRNGEFTIITD